MVVFPACHVSFQRKDPEKVDFVSNLQRFFSTILIPLMAEILHQLIGSLSHCFWGFIHPRLLAGFQPSTVSVYGFTEQVSSPNNLYIHPTGRQVCVHTDGGVRSIRLAA